MPHFPHRPSEQNNVRIRQQARIRQLSHLATLGLGMLLMLTVVSVLSTF